MAAVSQAPSYYQHTAGLGSTGGLPLFGRPGSHFRVTSSSQRQAADAGAAETRVPELDGSLVHLPDRTSAHVSSRSARSPRQH
jgi:hypothetical protein